MNSRWQSQCTLFQGKVYEAVLRIPKGQVRTYAWVAKQIGQPKAARAVGQALKRNRWPAGRGAASFSGSHWAPMIPCHRVVASNGTLGGYSASGGLKAKRRLLREEGVIRCYDTAPTGECCEVSL